MKLLGQNNFAKFGDTVPLSTNTAGRYTCTSITSQQIALDDETDLANFTYDTVLRERLTFVALAFGTPV